MPIVNFKSLNLIMKGYISLLLVLSAIACINGQSYFPIPAIGDTVQFKAGIATTASLLTSFTKSDPKAVKDSCAVIFCRLSSNEARGISSKVVSWKQGLIRRRNGYQKM